MALNIFTDGASSGNPGPGWAMWVIMRDGKEHGHRVRLAYCTNNEAEYFAVIHALEDLIKHPEFYEHEGEILFHLDSNLVVQQLNGMWKIKEARMWEYVQKINKLLTQIKARVRFIYIPREQNLADKLKYA